MIGKVGDQIVVGSMHVGEAGREGRILEVTDSPSGPHYLVRWDDGHESLFMPKAGSARIVPARHKRAV